MTSGGGEQSSEVTFLCRLEDISDPGAKGVLIGRGPSALDLIIVRQDDRISSYRNAYPHQGTPLELFPDKLLDETRAHLLCSTHGARFLIGSGKCVRGPCEGSRLEPIAVSAEEGAVYLG